MGVKGARYGLRDIPGLMDRAVFVDANVVLYLFWPSENGYWPKQYRKMLNGLQRQGNALFVDFLVISEVFNRAVRAEHRRVAPKALFKTFRDSVRGRSTIADIAGLVRRHTLDHFTLAERCLGMSEMEHCLSADSKLDFTDRAVERVCLEKDLVLLTNDADFEGSLVDTLSANPALLESG